MAFLEGLYTAAGYTTQKRWAEEGDYHPTNLSTAMNRALPDGIDGYSLLKLISAAAERADEPADRLALRIARDESSSRAQRIERHLEELSATVGGLPTAQDLESAAKTLQAAIDQIATRGTGEGVPTNSEPRGQTK